MTDPYRITTPADPVPDPIPNPRAATSASSDRTDTLLWVVLILSMVGNATTSLVGQSLLGLPFGVAVLVSGVVLVKRHLGRRK